MLDEEEMAGATPFTIATGVSAAPFLAKLVDKAKGRCPGLVGQVVPIRNDFFGHTITVAGLVTGGDLIAQLRGKELGRRLLIPASMLRSGERGLLDDVTVDEVERELDVAVVAEAQDGWQLCEAMIGMDPAREPTCEDAEETEYFRYR